MSPTPDGRLRRRAPKTDPGTAGALDLARLQEAINGSASPRRGIARQLAVAFGLISTVTALMYGMVFIILIEVSRSVDEMRSAEAAIRSGQILAAAVREQYMHQAHWLIERDDEHVGHFDEWHSKVVDQISALRSLVPEERHRLQEIESDSLELDKRFRDTVRPAALARDTAETTKGHRIVDAISRRAADNADELVRAVEQRMFQTHASATRLVQIGLLCAGLCVALVVLLSVWFTVRLRRAVLLPLGHLARAASKFGAGEFDVRVGNVGQGELRAVARAFDHMAVELQARETRLLETERLAALGQLAAGVAHEINNPVGIIRGYLKTMDDGALPPSIRQELGILDEEAAACQRIAEDLLAYARALELNLEPTRIDALLGETVKRFTESQKVGIALTAEPVQVQVDVARIRQLALNLLLNAAQAGDRQRIEVHARRVDDDLVLEVADRGTGIEEADATRIFEPFFGRRPGGSGLGLAVCDAIAKAHGGRIRARARSGGGSVFTVTLPLAPRRNP